MKECNKCGVEFISYDKRQQYCPNCRMIKAKEIFKQDNHDKRNKPASVRRK